MKDRSRREGERERGREGERGGEFVPRVMEDAINNESREKKLEIVADHALHLAHA